MRPSFDDRDQAIKHERIARWNKRAGPRVGDFLQLNKDQLHRFTHDWGEDIQITDRHYPGHGSFYFGGGYCSYSGGLDSAIAKDRLEDTGEIREGTVWFFHHGYAQAHNGVHTTIPCRVYRLRSP